MTEYDDLPTMAPPMERDLSGFTTQALSGDVLAPPPMMLQTQREITAKRVAVPRHIPNIMREIREMCAAFGDTYVYSWEVNNRREGRKDTIKGPTIKMAMMLVQAFGNCSVDMDIQETPTHWIFKSWFMDYEKGTSLSRLFQQRKNQNTGMKDADRAMDMVFQMGQSKGARNVIVNALSSFAAYAMEEAEKGLLAKFSSPDAIDRAWAYMEGVMATHGIDIKRVEAVIGRRRADFTIPNLAKAYMMLRGVGEGMTSADDQFPTLEAATEMQDEQDAERKALRGRAGKKAADKADPAPAEQAAPAKDEKPAQEAQERAPIHQQPPYAAAGAEAAAKPQEPSAKQGDELQCDDFLIDLKGAASFEAIEAVRTAYSKVVWPPALATKLKTATGEARERVKDAAKAKPAETAPAAEDEFDEEAALSQIEEMFSGLTKLADVETTRDSLVKVIGRPSEAGVRRATMIYNTAQNHAKAKEAEVTPEASETTMLFGDD